MRTGTQILNPCISFETMFRFWIVYILKCHSFAMTSPRTILFMCNNWNGRSSIMLTGGIELPLHWFWFTLSRMILGSFISTFWAELYHSKLFRNLVWMQSLSSSPTNHCSVFSVYFLVKGSIISYFLTCNSCCC